MTREETFEFAKIWLRDNWTTFNPAIGEGLYDFIARCLTDFSMAVNQPMRTLTPEEMQRFKDHTAIRGVKPSDRLVYIPKYELQSEGVSPICYKCYHNDVCIAKSIATIACKDYDEYTKTKEK